MAQVEQSIILDTSIVIKWFYEEEDWESADKLLEDISFTKRAIIVPRLFFYELGNVLLSKKADNEKVQFVQKQLQELNLTVKDIQSNSITSIHSLARVYSLSFYDATYVFHMQQEQCAFITADKKLYGKLKNKFSKIKLL